MKPMSFSEFIDKITELHGETHTKQWSNYPQSVFFYDKPGAKGGDKEIGIYTNETAYYIAEAV